MAYVALRLIAGPIEADAWSDALLDAGAMSVDVGDAAAGTVDERPLFGEPGEREPDPADWTAAVITALLPARCDAGALLQAAAGALGASLPPYETFAVADADWVRATQSQFAPIEAAPDIWIVPSWCEPVEASATNIVLDPGLAFGTGSHPTTRLCIRWLAANLQRGANVLDYGCGSGILAIVAAKLGAARVVGVDIDRQAIAASRENARRNRVRARFMRPDAKAMRDVVELRRGRREHPRQSAAPARTGARGSRSRRWPRRALRRAGAAGRRRDRRVRAVV